MRLFRRQKSDEPEEENNAGEPDAHTDATPGPAEPESKPRGRRRWFSRRERDAKDTSDAPAATETPAEKPLPAAEAPRPRLDRRRSLPSDPLGMDEALEPLTMEIAGGQLFTVAVEPARGPGARPLELPPVLAGTRRRWGLPWRRRRDPLAEVAALVAEEVDEPEVPEVVEVAEAEPRRQLSLPWEVQIGALVFGLIALGVAVVELLVNLEQLSGAVVDLWPLGVLALGVLLMPGALRHRDGGQSLGSFALVAVGASLVLAQAEALSFGATLAATLVIALGASVMARGLFARDKTGRKLR